MGDNEILLLVAAGAAVYYFGILRRNFPQGSGESSAGPQVSEIHLRNVAEQKANEHGTVFIAPPGGISARGKQAPPDSVA